MSDYGTPPPPAPDYGSPAAGSTPPPNYLIWAILSTVLCCLPFGIVSIVFAAQVNGKWAAGDVAGAQESSAKAKKWAIWAVVAGIITIIIYGILVAMGVMAGMNASTTSP